MGTIVYRPGDVVRIIGSENLIAAFNADKGKKAIVVIAGIENAAIRILDPTEKKLAFNSNFHWWTHISSIEPWLREGEQLFFNFGEPNEL